MKCLNEFRILSVLQRRKMNRYGLWRRVSTQVLKEAKPFKSIPGLSSIPFIGPLHHLLPGIGEIGPEGQLFEKLENFQSKYGSIMKVPGIIGRDDLVFLFEPEHFQQVFRAEEVNPQRLLIGLEAFTYYREKMRQSRQGVYGLTTVQGPRWRDFRTKVNPAMLMPKLIKLYTHDLEEIADEMIERISNLKDQPELLQHNFEAEITKWSLESIAFVGLGARMQCMKDGLAEDHPSRKLIQCSKDINDLSFKLEFSLSPWRYISTPTFRKIVEVFDTQWEISSMYVNEAKKKIESRGHDIPEEDKSIIEKLLAVDETVAITMSNEMLLAGIDTVTFATMTLLYQLAVNQNAQDKLRQEIRMEKSNRYIRACMKESLRIWHVSPANLRRTSMDHVVAGYHIPEGVNVLSPNQYLSNNEKHFLRAKEFLPERWLVEKSDPLYHGNAHPMVNMPFGFGVRSCIGRRIAELEIEIFVKKLINEFKVTWDGPPMKVKTLLLNSVEEPYCIKFQPANSA